jgi:hypothetical protein
MMKQIFSNNRENLKLTVDINTNQVTHKNILSWFCKELIKIITKFRDLTFYIRLLFNSFLKYSFRKKLLKNLI